jgi:putative transcriptional regulator
MTKLDRFIKIKSNNLEPRKGRVLLSEPLMGDYYFGRSVVLLAEHNNEGSFGLIVNKTVQTKFNEILPDFPEFDSQLFLGGPVETNRLFILHTLGDKISESVEIIKGLYWGGNLDDIKEMISLNLANSKNIRFYLGYSGWSAGQLENELKRNSWVITRTSSEKIFTKSPENLWDDLVKKLGDEYLYWEKLPKNPMYN